MIRRVRLAISAHLVCKRHYAMRDRNSLSLFPLDRRVKRNRESMLIVSAYIGTLALTPNSRSPIFFPRRTQIRKLGVKEKEGEESLFPRTCSACFRFAFRAVHNLSTCKLRFPAAKGLLFQIEKY